MDSGFQKLCPVYVSYQTSRLLSATIHHCDSLDITQDVWFCFQVFKHCDPEKPGRSRHHCEKFQLWENHKPGGISFQTSNMIKDCREQQGAEHAREKHTSFIHLCLTAQLPEFAPKNSLVI